MMRYVRILASAWLLLVSGMAGAQDVNALIESVKSGDNNARQQAMEPLASTGAPAVAPLVGLLYGDNPNAHLTALQTLRRLAHHAARPGAEAERKAVAAALLEQVKPAAGRPLPARNAVLELVSFVATEENVPDLAALLNDKEVREMARFALVRIPGMAAGKALLEALPKADPEFQVALLGALGERGEASAAPVVRGLIRAADPNVRLAVIEAMGRLPDPTNAAVLWNIRTRGTDREKEAASRSFLTLADTLYRTGNRRAAKALYERLGQAAETDHEKCAALAGQVRTGGEQALPLLLAALKAPEREVRGLAALLLAESKLPAVTLQLNRVYESADLDTRLLLIDIYRRRAEDLDARAALLRAAGAPEEPLRIAAMRALTNRRGVPKPQLLDIYHKALPNAASDDERRVILAGIERIGDPSSLPLLQEILRLGALRNEALSATLPIAASLAREGKRDEAIALYQQALEQSSDPRILREAAGGLRGLGVQMDLVARLGFVSNWWVLGPIPGREEWRTKEALAVDQPPDLKAPLSINGASYTWKFVPIDDPTGMLDLEQVAGRRDNAAAYVYAEVTSPTEQDVLFKIGSDDDVVCWLNGQKAHEFLGDRGWSIDQDSVPVRLVAGKNRILMKVLNGGGQWACSLRITDREGRPLPLEQAKPRGESGK